MATATPVIVVMMVLMVFVMLVTASAVFTVFMVVMLIVVMMAAVTPVVVMVMVVTTTSRTNFLGHQIGGEGIALLHSSQQLCASQLLPRGGHNNGGFIMLAQERNRSCQFLLRELLSTAHHNRTSVYNLVLVKLTEVFQIDFTLRCIGNGHGTHQLHRGDFLHDTFHRFYHIAQLTHARRLNDNTVGTELLHHFLQSFSEVTHQRTADTTRIHLRDFDTSLLQEATVNADFSELIFNQNDFLTLQRFREQFFDKSRLTCAEKSRDNANLCHFHSSFLFEFVSKPPAKPEVLHTNYNSD